MSVAFVTGFRMAGMICGQGMILVGALLVKGRLEFDMTVGAEAQNGSLHRIGRHKKADKQSNTFPALILSGYIHDHGPIIPL